ncbi:MAG: L-serine ammonia-lyase [Robiginitomaculum sp.]|nr:MAG: L-serine ammonia-lyase [Robiginitomaculum sp.]
MTNSKHSRAHFGVFDLFKIGIGPSSSHTVGPMIAANRFLNEHTKNINPTRIKAELFGSLAHTGMGHSTDTAIILGLSGYLPHAISADQVLKITGITHKTKTIKLRGETEITFTPIKDIVFNFQDLMPYHSNAMKFTAYDKDGKQLAEQIYYSTGGGFIISDNESKQNEPFGDMTPPPFPFDNGDELLELCKKHNKSIAEIMLANECAYRDKGVVLAGINTIWSAMKSCIERGMSQTGHLPGPMKIERRAHIIANSMNTQIGISDSDPLKVMDYVNLWAMAVNEENAAGGRVVTAPTNGAAGIIPAVARFFDCHVRNADNTTSLDDFFLTAAAVGSLYKKNASISGAESGCQGEVGVACSMAAAGLAAAMGGTVLQVENAAEIGMEHNLGLTCDPVGGLVQIPCIERNAMGAAKAINAARLALRGDGSHHVSLDTVIETMRQTGIDMQDKYKETSKGGLAVNMPAC